MTLAFCPSWMVCSTVHTEESSLLTTNNLYVNENLIGRPSRIRYKKTFGNLQPEVVQEYLDDNLKEQEVYQ